MTPSLSTIKMWFCRMITCSPGRPTTRLMISWSSTGSKYCTIWPRFGGTSRKIDLPIRNASSSRKVGSIERPLIRPGSITNARIAMIEMITTTAILSAFMIYVMKS